MKVKQLTELDRLELSLKYSISEKHKKILIERINEIKNSQISMFEIK
ncbi:hypothetical protein [Clostridium akagii]|nr:hypothetical protein [Clostridium akagii]